MKEIRTTRLLLRPFLESDYDNLYEFLCQQKDDEFEGYPGITYENGRKYLQQRLGSEEFYAVVLLSSGKLIGNIYCGNRDFEAKEVGYIINRDYRKMGYAEEALSAVIRNAFQNGAHRVFAECDPRNTASWKLLEKVGLQREAHFSQNIWFHKDSNGAPVWKDTYVYTKLNTLTVVPVDETNLADAAIIHSVSWKESHRAFCTPEFINMHSPERQKEYLHSKLNNGAKLYMLMDEKPIGIVSVSGSLIEDLYILPDMQNMGYGTKLLQYAIGQCTSIPTLWILGNNVNAERLYCRMGFVKTGHKNRITDELDEVELVMDQKKAGKGWVLETERLFLREMNLNDYDALYRVLADPGIMKHYPYTFDEERVRGWIERNMKRYEENSFGLWAVCLKDTGEMIGDCGLTLQNIHGEMLPEIGYHIRRDCQHKGYAKEAALAVRNWAFQNTDYPALYSYCKYTNVPSYKTAESIGMHFDCEYPDEANGTTHVSVISRQEWLCEPAEKMHGIEKKNISIKIHDSLVSLPDNPWRKRTEMLEYEMAVKWFAVEARYDEELIGFMHLIRNPEKANEWFSCDVFTAEKNRRHGIATAMYEKALNHLHQYFKANCITASVKTDNIASVKLHEKIGFRNTHKASVFLDFIFEPGETLFEHFFAQEYPAKNVPIHQKILADLAGKNKNDILAKLKTSESNPEAGILILWAGETPIGYRLSGETKPFLLPEWKTHQENKCLSIKHI